LHVFLIKVMKHASSRLGALTASSAWQEITDEESKVHGPALTEAELSTFKVHRLRCCEFRLAVTLTIVSFCVGSCDIFLTRGAASATIEN